MTIAQFSDQSGFLSTCKLTDGLFDYNTIIHLKHVVMTLYCVCVSQPCLHNVICASIVFVYVSIYMCVFVIAVCP